ncbi:uncharacterized protein DFL_007127 [Arthrobotrys flagrans]|uniref:Uncharacterized protein n=1 Tax=Arthrobotrys flagrans TaxID=97331 RepID=A0A436ZV53_ARTFL|nr:hypothetical protein DFL_007127 [Arthrobotrys flagrans]
MESKAWYCRQKQKLLLTTSYFAIFTGCLFYIPGASAIPMYNQIRDIPFQSRPKLVNRHHGREVALPPGSTASDGSGDVVFYGEECTMGIYEGTFRNKNGPVDTGPGARWEGYPLGTRFTGPDHSVFPDNKCVNIRDLHPALPNQVSSYVVTGYCECRFYDHENCPNEPGEGGFSAYNREDASLWRNGPDDDTLESFACWYTKHFNEFEFCSIKFAENPSAAIGRPVSPIDVLKPQPPGQVIDKIFRKEDMTDSLTRGEGETDCQKLPEGIVLNYYKINGCSCRFFTSDNCDEASYSFVDGNPGRIEKIYRLPRDLRSYRCLVPFGIPWVARDDL